MKTLRKVENIVMITVFTIIEMMFVIIGFAYLIEEIMCDFEVATYFMFILPYIYIKVKNLTLKLRNVIRNEF